MSDRAKRVSDADVMRAKLGALESAMQCAVMLVAVNAVATLPLGSVSGHDTDGVTVAVDRRPGESDRMLGERAMAYLRVHAAPHYGLTWNMPDV